MFDQIFFIKIHRLSEELILIDIFMFVNGIKYNYCKIKMNFDRIIENGCR